MSTIVFLVLAILLLIAMSLLAAGLYFYNLAIARQAESPDLAGDRAAEQAGADPSWLAQQPFQRVEITSHDGLRLRGYYLSAKQPTVKTVILAHGYTSRAIPDMSSFAQLYHEHFHFNVLLPDDRGHGESEGSYIGFGWHDRLDYLQWIQYLIQRFGQRVQIALHGLSMGGATVLMVSGEPLPTQVKCIISDCAYTSARDILAYQFVSRYKLPPFPMLQLTSVICKLRAGYSFAEASAIAQVSKAHLPIFFIHGDADTFVPTHMVHRLYEQSQGYKEKYLIPGAGHGLAFSTDTHGYTQRVQMFLNKFIS